MAGQNVCVNASVVNLTDLAEVELFKGYSDGLLHFATACCIIFMCIGIPGNLITIIALTKYEKVRNATAIFIINLSLSDLLFCCFNLPLAASTFTQRSWIYGPFLCHMFPFARYALVAVSLFTISAITINRYIMIAHPRLYPKLYTPRYIGIIIAGIWAVSWGLLVATFFGKWGRFGLDCEIASCSILVDNNNRSPKRALFLIAFIIPSLAILFCYARIFFIVRKTTKNSLNRDKNVPKEEELTSSELSTSALVRMTAEMSSHPVSDQEVNSANNSISSLPDSANSTPGLQRTVTVKIESRDPKKARVDGKSVAFQLRRTALRKSMALLKLSLPTRKDRRLGTMIIAIMVSFWMCHLPITITKLLREIKPSHITNIASYILLYLSSSINPIIYVVMSNEYRKAYKNLFKRRRRASFPIKR